MDNTVQKVSDEKARTREQLDALILTEPDNEVAWLELSGLVKNKNEAIDCLEHVIQINPGNSTASQELFRLRRIEKNHQYTQEKSDWKVETIKGCGGCLGSFLLEALISFIFTLLFPNSS